MAELPRFLRRATSAALPAVLALGSLLSDAPKAFGAPPRLRATQNQAPQVSEQDARNFFNEMADDKFYAMTHYNQDYNYSQSNLLYKKYANAQTNQRAALAAAFAVNAVDQADTAAKEAYRIYARPADSEGDFIPVAGNDDCYRKVYASYANKTTNGETLVQSVAWFANYILQGASSDNMSVPVYLTKVIAPHKEVPGDPGFAALQKSARFFSQKQPNNNQTVAMVVAGREPR